MKICFLVPWITKGRGGTENVGQMMANAMAARGHSVDVITFDDDTQPTRWPLAEGIGLYHVPEEPGPVQDSTLLLTLASLAPDLVVGLHMNRTFLTYVRAARKLDLPLVLSEHQDPRFPARLGNFDPEERLIAFYGATRLHLLVPAFLDTLPAYLHARVRVIPNTAPVATVPADPVGDGRRPLRLVTVARLVARKNMHWLLEEFARIAPAHPDWELRVIGSGPLSGKLRAQARNLGLADRVVFCGEIGDVYGELSQAQGFVLPSLFEGFPMSSLEALAHGLPVVGFADCNGINVQVEHGVSGLLAAEPMKPGSLAQHMAQLMGSSTLRRDLGAAARTRYEAQFSNQVVFDQWEALFTEAAATDPAPRPSEESRLEAALDRMVFGGTI